MILIKIVAQFTKKRSKRRDRNFFRFLALKVFLTILLLKKGGAKRSPPISKRVKTVLCKYKINVVENKRWGDDHSELIKIINTF